MVFRPVFPAPGKRKRNAEDVIISILSQEFPLTLQQLHGAARRQFGIAVSYQAIRKAAMRLFAERILYKEGRQYSIDRNWILDSERTVSMLKERYFAAAPRHRTVVGDAATEYIFGNLIEKDRVWCRIQEDWIRNRDPGEAPVIAWQGMHNWWLLGQLEHETRFMERIRSEVTVYQLVNGTSPLDRWSVKYYRKLGVHCMSNAGKGEKGSYLVVFGDYVMETSYPPELVEQLERFYNRTRKIEDIDLNRIMSILTSRQRIRVTLLKNRQIAEKVRADIVRRFRSAPQRSASPARQATGR